MKDVIFFFWDEKNSDSSKDFVKTSWKCLTSMPAPPPKKNSVSRGWLFS